MKTLKNFYNYIPYGPRGKNKSVLRRLIDETFNKRNLEILPELLHKDFVNHNDLLPTDSKKGPAVFEELYTKIWKSFPDIKIYNHLIIAKYDMVVSHDTLSVANIGPLPDGKLAIGKPVEFEELNILRLQEEKVIESWGISDNLVMMK